MAKVCFYVKEEIGTSCCIARNGARMFIECFCYESENIAVMRLSRLKIWDFQSNWGADSLSPFPFWQVLLCAVGVDLFHGILTQLNLQRQPGVR